MESHSILAILGPVMIGPSSSHTAGAVKLGRLARAILGKQPQSASIYLHGSFRATGRGHGTHEALVAGLFLSDCTLADLRIPDAISIVEHQGNSVRIYEDKDLEKRYHPNTAKFVLQAEGVKREIVGSSVGGGKAIIIEIDDFQDLERSQITGETECIVIFCSDRVGLIANITEIIRAKGINIGSLNFHRETRGGRALLVLAVDKPLSSSTIRHIQGVKNVSEVKVINQIRV